MRHKALRKVWNRNMEIVCERILAGESPPKDVLDVLAQQHLDAMRLVRSVLAYEAELTDSKDFVEECRRFVKRLME